MTGFTLVKFQRVVESCVGVDSSVELTADHLDTELVDLGLDSLTVYEVVTLLQDDLRIRISDDEIDAIKTPRALIDFVNGRLAELAT